MEDPADPALPGGPSEAKTIVCAPGLKGTWTPPVTVLPAMPAPVQAGTPSTVRETKLVCITNTEPRMKVSSGTLPGTTCLS